MENAMGKQEALTILVNAAQEAQKRGAFNLEEAAIVYNAIKAFQDPPQEEPPLSQLGEVAEDKKSTKKKPVN